MKKVEFRFAEGDYLFHMNKNKITKSVVTKVHVHSQGDTYLILYSIRSPTFGGGGVMQVNDQDCFSTVAGLVVHLKNTVVYADI